MEITKRIITILLICIAWEGVNGQLQLENSYSFSASLTDLGGETYKYYLMDPGTNQCRIYNEDHTVYKTINLPVPSGYYLYDIKFVTRNLFNPDDYIELLYIYSRTQDVNGVSVNYYGLRVINETGTVLLSLTDGGYAEIKEGSAGPRLLVYQYNYADSYYQTITNVYSLGGTTKSFCREAQDAITIYPNPASHRISVMLNREELDGTPEIAVTDLNGKQVGIFSFPEGSSKAEISASGWFPGSYILTVSDRRGIVASKKVILN